MNEKILVTRSSMPPFSEYLEMIKPLWDTRWVTNMGTYHKELEEKLKDYLGVAEISLMTNGHLALELALQSMEFPEGSEVITTPFTFISTTHAIIRNKLIPVFCDIKDDDFTIDENKIENLITEKTVAILPVHVYGNPCNVERISEIAAKHNLKVIYDAAHAFGEQYKNKGIATYGDLSIFSFHATKVFNTIEGGAVCCNTQEQYEHLYNLKNFGIRSEELVVSVGTNAKMNEFQAAMGLCNMKYIAQNIENRKTAVELYSELLKNSKGIRVNKYIKDLIPNYSYMPVVFGCKDMRDGVYHHLAKNNIYARKYFYPLTSDSVCFKNKYKNDSLNVARNISERMLVLPLYGEIEIETVGLICKLIKEII